MKPNKWLNLKWWEGLIKWFIRPWLLYLSIVLIIAHLCLVVKFPERSDVLDQVWSDILDTHYVKPNL